MAFRFEFSPGIPPTKSFEKSPSLEQHRVAEDPDVDTLFNRLPQELQKTHLSKIDEMSDTEAIIYLQDLLERREKATREYFVSDAGIKDYFERHKEEIWEDLQTTVFTRTDNILGAGQTARIKHYHNSDAQGEMPPMAIKYLVTPTTKTLSASGEHDIIQEVERIERIEQDESRSVNPVNYIKVPHPYFYYRQGRIQCYGMEEINGLNLYQATETNQDSQIRAEFKALFRDVDSDVILQEVDTFFDTMHKTCLHGDIKAKNLMVSREGKFYVIDFGQSVLSTNVDDKSQEAFENLKDEEKRSAKSIIKQFLVSLQQN